MRSARRHIASIINAGTFASLCLWLFEQWLSARFPEWWSVIPWGLIAILAMGVWMGFQLAEYVAGNHWIQRKLIPRLRPFVFSDLKYREGSSGGIVEAYISIEATCRCENVQIVALIANEEHYVSGTSAWATTGRLVFGQRQNLNRGDSLTLTLLKAPRKSVVLDGAPADARIPVSSGFHRIRVSVTSTAGSITRDYVLWVNWGFALTPVPFVLDKEIPEANGPVPPSTELDFG